MEILIFSVNTIRFSIGFHLASVQHTLIPRVCFDFRFHYINYIHPSSTLYIIYIYKSIGAMLQQWTKILTIKLEVFLRIDLELFYYVVPIRHLGFDCLGNIFFVVLCFWEYVWHKQQNNTYILETMLAYWLPQKEYHWQKMMTNDLFVSEFEIQHKHVRNNHDNISIYFFNT